MLQARSIRHPMTKRPSKVIVAIITLWSFLFNMVCCDVTWAAKRTVGSTSLGPIGTGGSGSFNELNVDTFSLPEYLGHIKDSCKGNFSKKVVIHIQDAHCNYAVQHKIADIIGYLNKEYGIDIVNLEGGAQDYDLSTFTRIYDKSIREKTADYFVKEGLVNGAEYFAINNPEKATLWGIEDTKLYLDNLNVYRDSLKHKDEVDKHLNVLTHILTNLKIKIYSPELLGLDNKYSQYKANILEFKDYLQFLIQTAKNKALDIKGFTNIYLLSQTLLEEENIDFKKANNQRDDLIDKLQKQLSKNSLEELVLKTVGFRSEKISQKDFYAYLAQRANIVGIELAEFPDLQKYIVYISMYNAIDIMKVMEEMDRLENEIKDAIYQNDKQKELNKLSKNLALLKNIFGISLTKEDYKYYTDNEQSFNMANFVSFINKEAPLYKISAQLESNITDIDHYREAISKFYEYSFKRDDVFIKNLKYGARQNIAVVVTGGFHTKNLCEALKKENIAYVSIMPAFRNYDGYACPYFGLLAGNEAPLLQKLQPIFASVSSIQIASMLSSAIALDVWGRANIDAFRAAVLVQEQIAKGRNVVNITRDGENVVFQFENGSTEKMTIRALLDAVHQKDIDGQMEKMPEEAFADIDNINKVLDEVKEFLKSIGASQEMLDHVDSLKGKNADGRAFIRLVRDTTFRGHAGGQGIRINAGLKGNEQEVKAVIIHEIIAGFFGDHFLAERAEQAFRSSHADEKLLAQASLAVPIWNMTPGQRLGVDRDFAAVNLTAQQKSIMNVEEALRTFNVESRINYGFTIKQILEQWAKEYLIYATFDFGNDAVMAELEKFAEKDIEKVTIVLRQAFLIDRKIGMVILDINTKLDRLGFTDVKIAKVILSAGMKTGWIKARGDLHIDHDYNWATSSRFMALVPTDFNLQRDTASCLYVDIMPFVNGSMSASIDGAEFQGIIAHEAGHAIAGMVVPSVIADTDHTAHLRLLDTFMGLQPYIAIPEEVREHINSVQDLINLGEFISNWVAYKLYGQEVAKSLLLGVMRDAGQPQEGVRRAHLETTNRSADLIAFANKIGLDKSLIPSRLLAKAELYSSEIEFYEKLFDGLHFKEPVEIAEGAVGPLHLRKSDVFLSASADQGIYAMGAAEYAGESIGLGIERQAVESQSIPQHVKLLSATRAIGVVPENSVDKIACVGLAISTDSRQSEEVIADILTVVKHDGGLIHFKPRDKITDKDRWIAFCAEIAKKMNLELEVVNRDTAIHGILFKVSPAKISIKLQQAIETMPEELKIRIQINPAVTVKVFSFLGWEEVSLADVSLSYGQKILLFNESLNQYEVYVYNGTHWQLERASISEWNLLYNYNVMETKVEERERVYVYQTLGGALKDIGIPGTGEVARTDSMTLMRWEDISAGESVETKLIKGVAISAKFIVSEPFSLGAMPRGISSYHFYDKQGNLIIVGAYYLQGEELDEAIYHEAKGSHWITVLSEEARQSNMALTGELSNTIRRNAHILASAEESIAFGDPVLTPFHKRQVASMSQGLLEQLLQENRQTHHDLVKARLSAADYDKYLSYEQRFVSKLEQKLSMPDTRTQVQELRRLGETLQQQFGIALDDIYLNKDKVSQNQGLLLESDYPEVKALLERTIANLRQSHPAWLQVVRGKTLMIAKLLGEGRNIGGRADLDNGTFTLVLDSYAYQETLDGRVSLDKGIAAADGTKYSNEQWILFHEIAHLMDPYRGQAVSAFFDQMGIDRFLQSDEYVALLKENQQLEAQLKQRGLFTSPSPYLVRSPEFIDKLNRIRDEINKNKYYKAMLVKGSRSITTGDMQGYTITPYAGASRFELWAESLTAYFLCPDLLEQKDPTMFSLLSMVISPRLISKGLPAGVTMSRQLYQAKAFETALGEGQQVWLQVYNDGPDYFDNFRVYVNPGQGMLDKAVEIAKGVLGRSDAPHASFKYLSSESLIREQHKGATKLVFYCKTAEDAVRIVQIFRSHPSYGDLGSSGILTDTLPIDNVMMLSGGTREDTDARKPQAIEKLAVLVGAFNEAGIPLADGRFNDGKTRIPANPDELGHMVGQPAIATPVATGARHERLRAFAKEFGQFYYALLNIYAENLATPDRLQRIESIIQSLSSNVPKRIKDGYRLMAKDLESELVFNHQLLERYRAQGVSELLAQVAKSERKDEVAVVQQLSEPVRNLFTHYQVNEVHYLLGAVILADGINNGKSADEMVSQMEQIFNHLRDKGECRFTEPCSGLFIIESGIDFFNLLLSQKLVPEGGAAVHFTPSSRGSPNFIVVPRRSMETVLSNRNESFLHELHHFLWYHLGNAGLLRKTRGTAEESKAFDSFRNEMSAYLIEGRDIRDTDPDLLVYSSNSGILEEARKFRNMVAAAMTIGEEMGISRHSFLYVAMTSRDFVELKSRVAALLNLPADFFRDYAIQRTDAPRFTTLGELFAELDRVDRLAQDMQSGVPDREVVLNTVLPRRLSLPPETIAVIRTLPRNEMSSILLDQRAPEFLVFYLRLWQVDDPQTNERYRRVVHSSPIMEEAFRRVADQIIERDADGYRKEFKNRPHEVVEQELSRKINALIELAHINTQPVSLIAQAEREDKIGAKREPVPTIATPVTTGANDATTEMPAAKETSDTRTAVTVEALNACEGRGNDVKVVVGVPIGMNKAIVQSTISTVNRGLATNGFGRIEDNRQVRIFEIDPTDAEKTWQNQEKAMQKAQEGLAPEGRIVLFAPQMEKGPQLAGKTQEQYKGQGNISVVPDAYSDASPEQDIYPDIMLRVALGRNIAFYYTGHDPQGTLARINDLLTKVINGFMPIVSIDDLLSILKPLRIRPIDFKTITEWQKAQEAVATSA